MPAISPVKRAYTKRSNTIKKSKLSSTGFFPSNRLKKLPLVLFVLAFAGIGSYMLFTSLAATASIASVEAEVMTLQTTGPSIITDANASGTKAVKFINNSGATGSVTLPGAATNVVVRARGDQCKGSPGFSLSVDGIALATKSVTSGTWTDYSFTQNLATGSHTIAITGTNYGTWRKCARSLYVDKIGFVGEVAPVTTNGTTIFGSATPTVAESTDGNSLELGVKFKSDVSGQITGIRFYKSVANTGTHIGNLWDINGTKLASVTFTAETTSGWQEAQFATPVNITAGTVYVASYFAPVGRFASDTGYFSGRSVDNAPLHALADGASGGNGVAIYTPASSFPNQSYSSTNYWVDVMFAAPSNTLTTSVTVPVSGETVSGGVPVEAKASGPNGVAKVEFYLDNVLKATESIAPYCMAADNGAGTLCNNWDSTTVANGSHAVTAYAYDSAGNKSPASTVTFSVNNVATTSPSGQAMPVGDIPGWRQIFTDDFTTNVPLGSFPSAVSSKWSAYPYPWRDTKGQNTSDPTIGGWYNPEKTTSIAGGMMDIWMHTETLDGAQKRLVSAPVPKINGPTATSTDQLYGRYAVRFRVNPTGLVNNFTGYKVAWLLWPQSDVWPRDGEIDFPEGNLNSTIYGFLHKQDATDGGDQYYASSGKSFNEWRTAVVEWGPGRGAFYLDGQLMTDATGGKSEWFDRIPNTPMHWVLQSETQLDSVVPAANTEGHIQIDWVAVYKPQ